MYSKLMTILLLVVSMNSFADLKQINLSKVTNDEDNEVAYMYVLVNENNDIQNFGYVNYLGDTELDREEFPADIGYGGVVLERRKNQDIVILKSLNVDAHYGGSLEVDFLFNALTGSRGKFLIELGRTSDSWQLMSKAKIIKHLHLVSNKKPLIGTIGIKRINIIAK